MKKLIAVAVVALSVLTVSAQQGSWYVGTSGFNPNGSATDGGVVLGPMTGLSYTDVKDDASVFSIGLAPEVGYFVSDNLAVGLGVFYTYSKFKPDEGRNVENNTIGVNPYARYHFLNYGNFRMYGQLGFGYSYSSIDYDNSIHYFEIGLRPGIAYSLSDCFAINATFGYLGYDHFKQGGDNKISHFGSNMDMSSLLFGFTVAF